MGDDAARNLLSLQDNLPPVPFEAIRGQIERSFEAPLEQLFASVDPVPVGAASIAQVHKGVTPDGRTVAIKVLRSVDAVGSIDRARSETTLLASLNHHGLVTLFDARISDDATSYLVMEYVEGVTLRERIAEDRGVHPGGLRDRAGPELHDEQPPACAVVRLVLRHGVCILPAALSGHSSWQLPRPSGGPATA